MIQKEQIIGAIDIGTTKIVTIIGKKNDNGRLEILSMAKTESKGVKRGVVQNIEETVAAIAKTVQEAELKAGVKINRSICWHCRTTYPQYKKPWLYQS